MAKPEYAIREVSLAEVILFLLSVIILAAYHFDYRVATYIIFLDFFQLFKIIVALRQLMETKRHQKMFGSLPDAYYYDSLLMRKYNWIWTNILISLLAIAAAPCLFSAGFQTMVKRFLRLLFFFLERLEGKMSLLQAGSILIGGQNVRFNAFIYYWAACSMPAG